MKVFAKTGSVFFYDNDNYDIFNTIQNFEGSNWWIERITDIDVIKGTIKFKIVVDHPSVLNVIVNKVLNNETNKERINSMIDSFFAGCLKYDIYELAKKYNQFSLSDLEEIVTEIENVPDEIKTEIIKETGQSAQNVPVNAGGANNQSQSNQTSTSNGDNIKKNYEGSLYVYFDNDIPKSGSENYKTTYDTYTSSANKTNYGTNKKTVYLDGDKNTTSVTLDYEPVPGSTISVYSGGQYSTPPYEAFNGYWDPTWYSISGNVLTILNNPYNTDKDLTIVFFITETYTNTPDSTVVTDLTVAGTATIPGYISIADLKSIVSASTDFADFKARIAAL